MSPAVVLVGPPGAGKSTVGRILARSVGAQFVDLDEQIEAECGRSIEELFAGGETAFRDAEDAVLRRLLAGNDSGRLATMVVATGGGVVERDANRSLLRTHPVIYLTAALPVLAARVAGEDTRPLLRSGPAALKRLLTRRDPWYREVADWIVDADAPAEDVARRCQNLLASAEEGCEQDRKQAREPHGSSAEMNTVSPGGDEPCVP